ncbi:hypothetical protein AAG906_013793 [Vitis piasezkii]
MLVGYTNANIVGDVDSRKSTLGYLITFTGGTMSWQSKLKKCFTISTIEVEFIVAIEACKELLWMKKFLNELHIDVRYHYIRDVLEMKLLQLEKIYIDENGSDMLTKILPREKFEFC